MRMNGRSREPYNGNERRLLVSIDIGTTFTAASFCILRPGAPPKFEEVLRWHKQIIADGKIPSVILYNQQGQPKAFGDETADEGTMMNGELDDCVSVEWWKLRMRPSHLPLIRELALRELPPNTTVDDVFAHFLEYVKRQVQEYIGDQHADGHAIWSNLFPSMCVILTTPNGWEGAQQQRMRQATIRAGLVDSDGGKRVKFVTEAEAAILYSVDSGCINDWLVDDGHLILCDCGGGTIDITGYKITGLDPVRMEETTTSRCSLAGAVFVTEAAKEYLKEKLKGTAWDNEDALTEALTNFEFRTKRTFEDRDTDSWLKLSGISTIPALGIRRGMLRIPGYVMAGFFSQPLKSITEGLKAVYEEGKRRADKVVLVGGFVNSPYLFSELRKWGEENKIFITRPDGPIFKAVANGALAWHVDQSVAARFSKFHYGVMANTNYNPSDNESKGRPTFTNKEGRLLVADSYSSILAQGIRVDASKEFRCSYSLEISSEGQWYFGRKDGVYAYRGTVPPKFLFPPGNSTGLYPGFELICKINSDFEECFKEAEQKRDKDGKGYRKVEFEVCMTLGGTELTARTRWLHKGEYKYGPATVAFE